MADYDFKYRLQSAPSGRVDGSGHVDHDVYGILSDDGETWLVMPGYHKTFCLPSDAVKTVINMPDSTGAERQAKNRAYKDLLVEHAATQPTPDYPPLVSDWSPQGMAEYMVKYDSWYVRVATTNSEAATQAGRVDDYITGTLAAVYPVDFQL